MSEYGLPRKNMLEDAILQLLSERNLTVSQITETTGAPKSTVYKTVRDLEDSGRIRKSNSYGSRNVPYMLGTDDYGSNTIIPSFMFKGDAYKATYFLQVEDNVVTEPFNKLFLSLAQILKAAERLNDGASLEQTHLVLRRCKVELIKAKNEFAHLSQLADQILSDERLWNPVYLERFHLDDAWRPEYHDNLIEKLLGEGR